MVKNYRRPKNPIYQTTDISNFMFTASNINKLILLIQNPKKPEKKVKEKKDTKLVCKPLSTFLLPKYDDKLFWCWMILLGVFLVDSTYTLIVRMIRKEKFYLPHSLHAYQKLSRILNSHSKATLILFSINIFWLTPFAFLVAFNKIDGLLSLLISYVPLIFLVYYLKAGVPEVEERK